MGCFIHSIFYCIHTQNCQSTKLAWTEDEADAAEIQVKIRLPIVVSLNFQDILNIQPKNIINIEQYQTEK
jgi:hypothetical protein